MNLYIYDRVLAGQELPCRAAVASLQARLGVAGRLLQGADDPTTWMEIYEGVTEDFLRTLEDEAARQGFGRFLLPDGRRHPECFVECA